CASRDSSQLTNTLAPLGWGARLSKLIVPPERGKRDTFFQLIDSRDRQALLHRLRARRVLRYLKADSAGLGLHGEHVFDHRDRQYLLPRNHEGHRLNAWVLRVFIRVQLDP